MTTLEKLVVIGNLIDSIIADAPNEEVTARPEVVAARRIISASEDCLIRALGKDELIKLAALVVYVNRGS